MYAIEVMGNTWNFVFVAIGLALFLLSGVGFKPVGDRVHLLGLGLAAVTFPTFWGLLAKL
jgi:hypothetical protein